MGFISYHGEKEDRYTEVLGYSRAQQNEEWKKAEEDRISNWLVELTGDDKLAHLNIQELLKLVIVQYRALFEQYKAIVHGGEIPSECNVDCLWKDFSIDIADRHIQSFHIMLDVREKHLQTFIYRIFKISGTVSATEHLEKMSDSNEYRKYFVDSFDPTWTGRQFFHFLKYASKNDSKIIEEFFDTYKKLCLSLNLYFYQAFRPRDNGWIGQIEAERNAIAEMITQYLKHKHVVLNTALLQNPLYKKDEQDLTPISNSEPAFLQAEPTESNELTIPQSGLDRARFRSLIEQHGIPNYVAACMMLLDCKMPDNIRENYNRLVERMPILQDAINKFDNVYHADLDQFDDYFAPEALTVTATLVEYEVIRPSEEVLQDTRENVYQASKKLLLLVNEKIDEIYKFVTIETNAEARALEALLSQDGYVDPELKLRRN